jgi:methylated-DNA-protein-cysteine methyltransferase related protein
MKKILTKPPNSFKRIYAVVRAIPRGKVVTYGDVARRAQIKSPRLVGRALHANPDPKTIPCHRVVFADGRLSPAFAFGGIAEQARRLKKDGVHIVNGRVNLIIANHR